MKIVVGGQIDKRAIADQLADLIPEAEVEVKGDLEASMAIKSNQADYYIGACNTGGGGALAMALALLGKNNCATLSMPGKILGDGEIEEEVKAGKRAFGFTAQHREQVLPVLISAIKKWGTK